jgi:hypothetical protein
MTTACHVQWDLSFGQAVIWGTSIVRRGRTEDVMDQHSGEPLSSPELDFVSRWKQLINRAGGQARVAKQLDWSTSTASRNYRGDNLPSNDRLTELCEFLHVPDKDMLDLAGLLSRARMAREARLKGKTVQAEHATGQSSGPGASNTTVTQVTGDHIVQAPKSVQPARRRYKNRRIILWASAPILIAVVVVAIVAFSNSPSPLPSRPAQVQALSGHARMQLQPVQVRLTSLLAQTLGLSRTTSPGTVTGYVFRNSWNNSGPVCLGALTSGTDAGQNRDPVQALSCSNSAPYQIWIPAQWERSHQNLTWLVNYQYPSMCLNVNKALGDGSAAQLWDCYHYAYGPYGLAVNEAWDFGDWYVGMTSAINPSPLFLGSSDFCLGADSQSADPGKGNNLPDGTMVGIWPYSHAVANQYWSLEPRLRGYSFEALLDEVVAGHRRRLGLRRAGRGRACANMAGTLTVAGWRPR